MAKGTLIADKGSIRRSRSDLASLHTPEGTPTWKPVPHFELVTELVKGLEAQGVIVGRDEYCTAGKDDSRVFGIMDLRVTGMDTESFHMALGLRASNDRTMAIQAIAGARILVCSNMCFSGSAGSVVMRKRHTSRLDLASVVPPAIDQFLERAGAFRLDIDRMRNHSLTDGRAKEVLHDAFARGVLPLRLFPTVSELYFNPDNIQREWFPDRTLFGLNNAFTEGVKSLKPAPQHEAGIRIGRLFGRLLHGEKAVADN